MGVCFDARCPKCGAEGRDLAFGANMMGLWPLPLRELRRVVEGDAPVPGDAMRRMPEDVVELAKLVL